MSLIGKEAIGFTAQAAVDGKIIELSLQNYIGKYVLLFFYPLDFTFVCPTELHAFEAKKQEFKKRGAQILGCSVDSAYSHLAWLQTPRAKGGIEGVSYPLVSDLNKTIATSYDVLSDEGISYRGLFLIDKKGVIRHQLVNDLPIGRSVDESLRVLDALIFHETHGDVCPANWTEGEKSLKPSQEGLEEFFS